LIYYRLSLAAQRAASPFISSAFPFYHSAFIQFYGRNVGSVGKIFHSSQPARVKIVRDQSVMVDQEIKEEKSV
jgi:hypothetical protein